MQTVTKYWAKFIKYASCTSTKKLNLNVFMKKVISRNVRAKSTKYAS